jgi:hypothetical protein
VLTLSSINILNAQFVSIGQKLVKQIVNENRRRADGIDVMKLRGHVSV